MRLVDHGGRCCGARHIYEFPRTPYARDIEQLKSLVKAAMAGRRKRMPMLEVILTREQRVAWDEPLAKEGFIPLTEWINPNTSKKLTLFVCTGDSRLAAKALDNGA